MSNYLNNLLTTTTSKYNTLRRQLLSDEADGDTEDDSHITRVLRAYYTEKGRPFPQWLPPDPKAPQAAPVQMVSSAGRGYGNMGQQPQMGRGGGGGGGGLGDLWDSPSQGPPQQQQQEPLSLRRAQGRGGGGLRVGNTRSPEPQVQGRPLPSQRAGSHQSASSFRSDVSSQTATSGTSAQDRLKARLWGSGTKPQSPSPSQSASPSQPPPGRSPYDRPQAGGGRAPYPDDRGSGGYSGGRQQDNSYNMSANSPWAGNDDPYGPSYNSAPPQQPDRRRVGLPSGPRMR